LRGGGGNEQVSGPAGWDNVKAGFRACGGKQLKTKRLQTCGAGLYAHSRPHCWDPTKPRPPPLCADNALDGKRTGNVCLTARLLAWHLLTLPLCLHCVFRCVSWRFGNYGGYCHVRPGRLHLLRLRLLYWMVPVLPGGRSGGPHVTTTADRRQTATAGHPVGPHQTVTWAVDPLAAHPGTLVVTGNASTGTAHHVTLGTGVATGTVGTGTGAATGSGSVAGTVTSGRGTALQAGEGAGWDGMSGCGCFASHARAGAALGGA
jgi:hypothetical protein